MAAINYVFATFPLFGTASILALFAFNPSCQGLRGLRSSFSVPRFEITAGGAAAAWPAIAAALGTQPAAAELAPSLPGLEPQQHQLPLQRLGPMSEHSAVVRDLPPLLLGEQAEAGSGGGGSATSQHRFLSQLQQQVQKISSKETGLRRGVLIEYQVAVSRFRSLHSLHKAECFACRGYSSDWMKLSKGCGSLDGMPLRGVRCGSSNSVA